MRIRFGSGWWWVAGMGLVMVALLVWRLHSMRRLDPLVQGAPISVWLERLHGPDPARREEAEAVLLATDPGSIFSGPLRFLGERRSAKEAWYQRFGTRLPKSVGRWLNRQLQPYEELELRRVAVGLLECRGSNLPPARLGEILGDPEVSVAYAAALSLTAQGEVALPTLRVAMTHETAMVRKLAVDAAARMGSRGAGVADDVAWRLDDEDSRVALAAVAALDRWGENAVPVLRRLADGGTTEGRLRAVEALRVMSSLRLRDATAAWVLRLGSGEDPEVRLAVLPLLGRVTPFEGEVARLVEAALTNGSTEERLAGLEAVRLSGIRDGGWRGRVEVLTVDPVLEVRSKAASLLVEGEGGGVGVP